MTIPSPPTLNTRPTTATDFSCHPIRDTLRGFDSPSHNDLWLAGLLEFTGLTLMVLS